MGGQVAKDPVIAALADAQHGVVARSQLLMRGLTSREIERRVEARRLNVVHRGVYAVGHRGLTVEGRWMAAVLAVGPDAALSHVSAAMAWDLRRTASGVIHVTVPGDGGRKRRRGIKVHRSVSLRADDVTVLRGIPITTAERTIIDLAD